MLACYSVTNPLEPQKSKQCLGGGGLFSKDFIPQPDLKYNTDPWKPKGSLSEGILAWQSVTSPTSQNRKDRYVCGCEAVCLCWENRSPLITERPSVPLPCMASITTAQFPRSLHLLCLQFLCPHPSTAFAGSPSLPSHTYTHTLQWFLASEACHWSKAPFPQDL